MHDVAWRDMWICVRSKDAQKQLARTSLITEREGVTGKSQTEALPYVGRGRSRGY